jgi:hypothetical protein
MALLDRWEPTLRLVAHQRHNRICRPRLIRLRQEALPAGLFIIGRWALIPPTSFERVQHTLAGFNRQHRSGRH